MSSRSERFTFDLAGPGDSRELLEILEEEPFPGAIALLYTRRPDPYSSFVKEGDEVTIVVCRDLKKSRIVGFGVCAVRNLYLNGEPRRVGYLFGLRGRREYSRVYPLLSRGYQFMKETQRNKEIDLFITTILEGNLYAIRMLEKPRGFMPAYSPLGLYEVCAVRPARASLKKGYRLQKAGAENLRQVVSFLNEKGRCHQLFPALSEDDLTGRLPGLTIEDFHVLYLGNEVVAVGALWDQRSYKQYIVKSYSRSMKLLYPFSFLLPLMGLPRLPRPGARLDFPTLSFWALTEPDPSLFSLLLAGMARIARDYPFFLVGVHENSPFRKALDALRHLKYRSRLYAVSFEGDGAPVHFDCDSPIYLECGML